MDEKLMTLSIMSIGRSPRGVDIGTIHPEAGMITPGGILTGQGIITLSEDDPLLVVQSDQEGRAKLLRAIQEIDLGTIARTKDPAAHLLMEEDWLVLRGLGQLTLIDVITTGGGPVLPLMYSPRCRRR